MVETVISLLFVAVAAFLVASFVRARKRQWQMLADRPIAAEESVPARLSPFWRRLTAFILDLGLLSAIEAVVRVAFSDPLSHFGDYRRLIAWAVLIVYFGVLESRWGGGRSLGKRLVDLCVIRADNTLLSPVEAGLRAGLLTAPFIFNGAHYDSAVEGMLLAVTIFGLFLAMLYLLALTNNERQVLLHDQVFGTLVVRQQDRDQQRPPPITVPLWRGHLVVVSLILLAPLLLPFSLNFFVGE